MKVPFSLFTPPENTLIQFNDKKNPFYFIEFCPNRDLVLLSEKPYNDRQCAVFSFYANTFDEWEPYEST